MMCSVTGAHCDPRLQHDRSRIELGCHEVYAGAVLGVPGGEHAAVRVEAAVGGEERRMDVEHAPEVTAHQCRRENAHEARERNRIGLHGLESREQHLLERPALRFPGPGRGCDTLCARARQACGAGPIGDHDHRLCGDFARARGTHDRAHVGAAAGDQQGELQRRARAHSWMTTPRLPLRTSPMTCALSPCATSSCTAAAACAAGTMTIMPMPQLKVRYISAASMRATLCNQSNT